LRKRYRSIGWGNGTQHDDGIWAASSAWGDPCTGRSDRAGGTRRLEECGDGDALERFHLQRAARRAYQDKSAARRMVTRLRHDGFNAVATELQQHIQKAEGNQQKLLLDFYRYVHNNQDGLLDLEYRACFLPACLGAIEGNVDKLVVHRMKGRGCSWRLPGVRAMLALCRNADQLRSYANLYLPLQTPPRPYHTTQVLDVQYSETTQGALPVFHGPHQNRPWVRSLHRLIYGR
jgi:hypothetical protein